jgi:hypothetical protein
MQTEMKQEGCGGKVVERLFMNSTSVLDIGTDVEFAV